MSAFINFKSFTRMPSDLPVKSDSWISPNLCAGLKRLVLLLMVVAPLCQARALTLFPPHDQSKSALAPAGKKNQANRARRLQQEVMDFSDRFVMGIWQALDEYLRSETDPRKRLAAETLKTSLASSSMEIAAGSDPAANLLDMYVFMKLSSAAIRNYWVPEVFGSKAEGLVRESARLQRELDGILSDLLPSTQLEEVDNAIKTWQRTHPEMIYITDTRLRDLVEMRSQGQAKASGGFPILSDLQKAVGEVDDALHYGERMMFYLGRLSRLTTMQTALTLAQAEASPSMLTLTGSASKASDAFERLPADLSAALTENSEAAGKLLPGIQATMADARAMAEALERISKQSDSAPAAEPWTPSSTATALREAQSAAREIRATVEATRDSLQADSSLEKLVQTSMNETRQTIDHTYCKALWVLGAFLLGQFFLLLCAARLFRPAKNSSAQDPCSSEVSRP
jgi:hypothetical protein